MQCHVLHDRQARSMARYHFWSSCYGDMRIQDLILDEKRRTEITHRVVCIYDRKIDFRKVMRCCLPAVMLGHWDNFCRYSSCLSRGYHADFLAHPCRQMSCHRMVIQPPATSHRPPVTSPQVGCHAMPTIVSSLHAPSATHT